MTELEMKENPVIASEDSKGIEPWKVSLPIRNTGHWIRFKEELNYAKPNCNLIQGVKESGKSSLVENLTTHYAEQHEECKIVEAFGSRDLEGLSWCRSPYKNSILFLIGDSVNVHSRWDNVRISKLSLKDFERAKVIVTCSEFFSSPREEHQGIQRLMTVLYGRKHWDHVWTIVLRELANLAYSRITIGEDASQAKAYLIFVLREMRHMGYALCADSIKSTSVDSDIRALADYTFLKACGKEGLPRDLEWLYSLFKPYGVMRMPIDRYIIVSKKGTVGRGEFDCPPWHKREREDLLKILDIHVDHDEALDLSTKKGRISDTEHVHIVTLKHDGVNGAKLSYPKLAGRCDRSISGVFTVVNSHNQEINAKGFCSQCRAMNCALENVKV